MPSQVSVTDSLLWLITYVEEPSMVSLLSPSSVMLLVDAVLDWSLNTKTLPALVFFDGRVRVIAEFCIHLKVWSEAWIVEVEFTSLTFTFMALVSSISFTVKVSLMVALEKILEDQVPVFLTLPPGAAGSVTNHD